MTRTTAPADLVLRNARIHTVDPRLPAAEALAVRDGRIVWLGPDAEAAAWAGRAPGSSTARAGWCCPASSTRTTTYG